MRHDGGRRRWVRATTTTTTTTGARDDARSTTTSSHVFSPIASSSRHPRPRLASPRARPHPNRPNRIARISSLARRIDGHRHAPARARRRRRRGRARPWTPFRRIRSNRRERRRAWWICGSRVAYRSSVVEHASRGASLIVTVRPHPRRPARVWVGDPSTARERRRRARDDAGPVSIEPMRWREILARIAGASSRSIGRSRAREGRAIRSFEIDRSLDRSIAREGRAVDPPRPRDRRDDRRDDERRSETIRDDQRRDDDTHRLVAFAALKARTLPRTADCVMDAMVVEAARESDARCARIRVGDSGARGGLCWSHDPSMERPARSRRPARRISIDLPSSGCGRRRRVRA